MIIALTLRTSISRQATARERSGPFWRSDNSLAMRIIECCDMMGNMRMWWRMWCWWVVELLGLGFLLSGCEVLYMQIGECCGIVGVEDSW